MKNVIKYAKVPAIVDGMEMDRSILSLGLYLGANNMVENVLSQKLSQEEFDSTCEQIKKMYAYSCHISTDAKMEDAEVFAEGWLYTLLEEKGFSAKK